MNYCCSDMKFAVENKDVYVEYNKILRQFMILPCMAMKYCPFCRKKLPKELNSAWCKTLKKEHKLIVSVFDIEDESIPIPDEFKTDEWWKKRGL